MRIQDLIFAFAVLETGCGLDDGDGSGVSSAELRGATQVRGNNRTRYRLSNGTTVVQPSDLSTTVIEAQVERDGAFQVLAGTGRADGSFAIDGVPRDQRYWLRVGTNWYLTRERVVDIGRDILGRPDAVNAAAGTSLVFDVDGLTPVTAGDDFQLEAPDARVGFYSTASALNPITAHAPAPGDTALVDAVFPFDQDAAAGTSTFPLIQASRGDAFTLAQLTTRQLGAITYQSLERALTTPVEMTQGAATTIHGTLTALPLLTTTVQLRQAAFEALAGAIHPGTVATGMAMVLDPNPAGRVVNLGTPDLVVASVAAGSGDQALPLVYGNPYPATWPRYVQALPSYQVPYTGPVAGGGTTSRVISLTELVWQFVDCDRATLAPVVSPPRDVEVDGERAGDGVQASAATPVVSWDEPRLGRPAAYSIRIVHLNTAAPFTSSVARLVLDADTHRIRIPAGLLQPGEHYNFQVRAIATAEQRDAARLEPAFVPPAGIMEAESGTIRVD